MPLKPTWDGYLSPADDVGYFVVIKCLGSLLYFGAGSLSSVSSGFQPSSKSGRGGVGFWAVPPGSPIVVGCLLPFRTGALHTVHSGMTGIPVWRKSAWRHLWEPQVAGSPGDRKAETPALMLFPGHWQWHRIAGPCVDLSFKRSLLLSGIVCCRGIHLRQL